jgi:hypothetical protein
MSLKYMKSCFVLLSSSQQGKKSDQNRERNWTSLGSIEYLNAHSHFLREPDSNTSNDLCELHDGC